jgi:hypothetical protein
MRTNDLRSRSPLAAAFSASNERRQRTRLRDLCDEVLASFRMARQADQFSERDRAEGKALVGRIVGQTR